MNSEPDSGARRRPNEEFVVPSVLQSVAKVRRFAVAECAAQGFAGDSDTMALLVSEVATNALIYGTGHVRVRVLPSGQRLRVEVMDDSAVLPVRSEAAADAEGGRGLGLVDALAAAWGVEPHGGGKTVWFELDG